MFDGGPSGDPGFGGDLSGVGCGTHIVLICVVVLLLVGLMKWLG